MNTSDQDTSAMSDLADGIRRNAKQAVWCGVLLLIAGFLAVMSPFVAGVSITIVVGALLAISGIGECFLAFKAGAFGKGLLIFVVGLLMAIAGIYMMSQPVAGLAALTIILMWYFIVSGAIEIFMGLQLRPEDGWGLLLFNGIVTFVLGILLWRQFPLSGGWAIGVLFGIKMIFTGWAFIFIGLSLIHI